jgi:hypothetical protein
MSELRPFMIEASRYETPRLLAEWRWLVPSIDTPLFISVFGDWVFGHSDDSLWVLSVLEGTYSRVAHNAAEYNTLNKSADWLDKTFIAGWQPIAAGHGLLPNKDNASAESPSAIGGKLRPPIFVLACWCTSSSWANHIGSFSREFPPDKVS